MVTFQRVEQGIYVYDWSGRVSMRDAMTASKQLIAQNNNAPFVGIIDMRENKNLPTDISTMRNIIKAEIRHGLRGYVILGASRSIEVFIKPLAALAPTTYKFTQEWDAALQMARDLLKNA